MSDQRIWYVTGSSKGMGLELVKLLLAKGEKVAATSRDLKGLESKITGHKENFLPLEVDLSSSESVEASIHKTAETFGKLDVVVNNAGYYILGAIEEVTPEEFRQSMDINLFGAVHVIRAAMPYLRKQRSGHIINISSATGYFGSEKTASYNAPKFALIGVSEALAEEVKGFGVKVTLVAPGVFRTNFLDKRSLQVTKNIIDEYKSKERADLLTGFSGVQSGDPQKLVEILYDLPELENPPLHLLLGPDCYQMVKDRRKADDNEFEKWKHITLSTDFDEQQQD